MTQNNTDKLLAFADSLEWKPIEIAPRDGTEYLLKGVCEGSEVTWLDSFVLPRYAFERSRWLNAGDMGCVPTHWMPIPTGNAGAVIRELVDAYCLAMDGLHNVLARNAGHETRQYQMIEIAQQSLTRAARLMETKN